MRVLVVNFDYAPMLAWLYRDKALRTASFAAQTAARDASRAGVYNLYTHYLNAAGATAMGVYANNGWAQRAWARERGLPLPPPRRPGVRWRRGVVPWPTWRDDDRWLYAVLDAQIEDFRPDVLLLQALHLRNDWFAALRGRVRLRVAQHAAPWPSGCDLRAFDLFVSSLPNLVQAARAQGVDAEHHRLAFDARLSAEVPACDRDVDVSFVGSLFGEHGERRRWLEAVAAAVPLQLWGRLDAAAQRGPLGRHWHGEAWGRDMYAVLRRSRITLNVHSAIAGPHANNLRLYEATGMGALLITDMKDDLHELYRPSAEVIAADDAAQTVAAIRHFLRDDESRRRIAAAGTARTLADHGWGRRMAALVQGFARRLS